MLPTGHGASNAVVEKSYAAERQAPFILLSGCLVWTLLLWQQQLLVLRPALHVPVQLRSYLRPRRRPAITSVL